MLSRQPTQATPGPGPPTQDQGERGGEGEREGEEIERGEAEQGLRLPARFYVKLVIPNANLDIAVNSIKERFAHLNGD